MIKDSTKMAIKINKLDSIIVIKNKQMVEMARFIVKNHKPNAIGLPAIIKHKEVNKVITKIDSIIKSPPIVDTIKVDTIIDKQSK